MPGRDGTGPLGLGPRTGRGLGYCGRGFASRFGFGWFSWRRGRGIGRGRGRGWRFW